MKKNPHGIILRVKPKEQHLSIVPKSCPFFLQPMNSKVAYTQGRNQDLNMGGQSMNQKNFK